MNRKRRFLKGVAIVVFPLILLGLTATSSFALYQGKEKEEKAFSVSSQRPPQDPREELKKDKTPHHVKGEILIKFKEKTGPTLNQHLSKKSLELSPTQTGLVSLDRLNAHHKVKKITPLFKALKEKELKTGKSHESLYEETKTKFPKRSKRIPKDAKLPNLSNIYQLEFEDKDADVLSICSEYEKDPSVEYCEPNYLAKAQLVPNDPYYSSSNSWGQGYDDLWGLKAIKLERAWDVIYARRGDLDKDGDIDMADVELLSQYALGGGPPPIPIEIADVNGDDQYDILDVTDLVRFIQEGSPVPVDYSQNEVVVAVSDTGVDYNHPDLQENIWVNPDEIPGNNVDDDGNGYVDDVRGYDFTTCRIWNPFACEVTKPSDNDPMDDNGHGTHVSGTIAATPNNGIGVPGVSWHAKVMAVKGLNGQGIGSVSDLVNTIYYAADEGADILNMSWGGSFYSRTLAEAVDFAYATGVFQVAAAGNDGIDVSGFSPASLPHVMTVSSSNHENGRSTYSNYGEAIDIAAPGGYGNSDKYWSRSEDPGAFGGSYAFSSHTGAYSSLSVYAAFGDPFDLTITWYIVSGPDQGITEVYVNGELYQSFDNYSPTPQFVHNTITLPIVPGLFKGFYEITSVVSGGKNPNATGYGSAFDGIRLEIDAVLLAEADDGALEYDDGDDPLLRRDILSLRAAGTDMYGDGHSIVANDYYRSRGTSMAAPHVSGVAALLLSRGPTLSPDLAQMILETSAQDLLDPGKDIYSGYGLVDAEAALTLTQSVIDHPLPELSVSKGSALLLANHQVEIKAEVANEGMVPVNDVSYRVYAGSVEGGIVMAEGRLSPIGAGESTTVDQLISLGGEIPSSITIQIDPDGLINEYVKTNNQQVLPYTFPSLNGWPQQTVSFQSAIASPAIADVDPNYPGLEIVVGSNEGRYDGVVYAWHADGTPVSGWPQNLGERAPVFSSPAIADIDPHYSGLEVIVSVGSLSNNLYAWHADGTPVSGWPKTVAGSSISSPAVSDIDGDGTLEIIVGSQGGFVYAWHADGTPVSGWPQSTGSSILSSPAIAEIDPYYAGLEIVVGTNGKKVYAWHADGTPVSGWPQSTGNYITSSPSIGDIDGDSVLEIVIGSLDSKVYAWHADGTPVSGWPQSTIGGVGFSSPALANLEGDSKLEVVAVSDYGYVYAWHADGTPVLGWPQQANDISSTSCSLALADLDGDREVEVVVGSGDGYVYAWHADGTPVSGWPQKPFRGVKYYSSPAVADIDGNGTLEIVIGVGRLTSSTDPGRGTVYTWTLPWTSPHRTPWPMFRKNLQRTGSNAAPLLNPIGNKVVTEGKPLEFTVRATDVDNDPLTYSATGIPLGATFDTVTGRFYWPKATIKRDKFGRIIQSTYQVIFGVTDGMYQDTETITIKVRAALPVAK